MDVIKKHIPEVAFDNFYSRIKGTAIEKELVNKRIALQHLEEFKENYQIGKPVRIEKVINGNLTTFIKTKKTVTDAEVYEFLRKISKPRNGRVVPYAPNKYSTFECVTFSFNLELFCDLHNKIETYLINATRAFRSSITLTFIEEDENNGFYSGYLIHK